MGHHGCKTIAEWMSESIIANLNFCGGERKMKLLELVKLTEEGENIVLEVLDKEKGTTEKQKVTPKVLASYEACTVCGLWIETDEKGENVLAVKVEK